MATDPVLVQKEEIHHLTYPDVYGLCDQLAAKIRQLPYRHDVMLVPTRGGLIMGGIMSHKLGMRFVLSIPFEEQYAAGETESEKEPRMLWFPPRELLKDRRILVLDDIRQRGRTLFRISNEAGHCDPMVVDNAALLDKPHKNEFPEMRLIHVGTTKFWEIFPWEEDGPLPNRLA